MSFFGLWMVLPVGEPIAAQLASELGPVIERQVELPRTRELWQQWQQHPERVAERVEARWRPGLAGAGWDFHELSSACPLDEHYELIQQAWAQASEAVPPLVVTCRKGYPVAALAYGLGPQRFAQLPGWFGDFVLDAGQTREALKTVELALALSPAEHREAEERMAWWLCNVGDGNGDEAAEMLDGLVPLWRAAADAGMGLFGHMVTPY